MQGEEGRGSCRVRGALDASQQASVIITYIHTGQMDWRQEQQIEKKDESKRDPVNEDGNKDVEDQNGAPEEISRSLPDSSRRVRKLAVRGLWLLGGHGQRSRGS